MLRQTGYSRIYNHRKVVEIELAGFNILGTLMDEFISALDSDTKYHKNIRSLIPGQYQINAKTRYEQLRAVIDYLSGMTDVYALEIYRTIKGIEMPSLR
jgi:dGTPase